MNCVKIIPRVFLCGMLALSLIICGCTSSDGSASSGSVSDTSGISGTYKNSDDASISYVLKSDGTFQYSNGAGGFSGTYSIAESQLKLCTKDADGSSCYSVPIEADGSFVYGYNTFRK
jgi:major membrane immunogen (membrane-anchored lipoprotein)